MAILDACDELHTFAALLFVDRLGEVFVQIVNKYASVACLQIAAIVGDDLAVFKGDDIAADGKVIVCHFVSDTGSLQRSATLIHFIQIIAKDSSIGHFRSWWESFWHGDEPATATFTGQQIHHWLMGILQ